MSVSDYNSEQIFKSGIHQQISYFAPMTLSLSKDINTPKIKRALELLKEVVAEYEKLI